MAASLATEDDLLAVWQQLPFPVFRLDAQGRLLQANAAFGQLCGPAEPGRGWQAWLAGSEGAPLRQWLADRKAASLDTLMDFHGRACRWQLARLADGGVSGSVQPLSAPVAAAERLLAGLPVMAYRSQAQPGRPLVYCNSVAETLTGMPARDWVRLARPLDELVLDDDVPAVSAAIARVLAGNGPASLSYRLHLPDGSVRWVEDHVERVEDGGEAVWLEGCLQDVTARHERSQLIADSQRFLRDLYDHAADMLLSVDPHTGCIQDCNQTLLDSLGYQREAVVGQPVFEFYTSGSRQRVEQVLLPRFLAEGHLDDEPLEVLCCNGKVLPVMLSSTAVRDDHGRVVRSRSVWRTMDSLQRSLAALQRSEQRFADMIEALPIAAGIYDAAGGIHYLNPAFTALFGYTRHEVPDMQTWWQLVYPDPDYRARMMSLLQSDTDRQHGGIRAIELTIRCREGRDRTVSVSRVALPSAEGMFVVTMVDLTEIRQQQQELAQRETRYRQLFEHAGVSLWKEDLTRVSARLAALRREGVTDLEACFDQQPALLTELVSLVRVLDVNRASQQLFGAEDKTELMQGIGGVLGAGGLAAFRAEMLAWWRGESVFTTECELQTLDGKPLRVIASLPLPHDIESASLVPVSLQDISARHALEAELQLHSQILQYMEEGVHLVNIQTRCIVYANPCLERMFGYGPGEMAGLPVSVLNAPGEVSPETVAAHIISQLEKQGHWYGQVHNVRRDGSLFWCSASVSVVDHPQHGRLWITTQQDISRERDAQQQLAITSAELSAVTAIQSEFIEHHDEQSTFETVLAQTLQLTGSEYGFVGEVLYDCGQPYLRTHALTDLSWDDASRAQYKKSLAGGMEFRNLDTLFGEALRKGEPVIANDVANDPRAGGRPAGHPPLRCFLCMPVRRGETMVGLIGVANRPGGYNRDVLQQMAPVLTTYAQLIHALRTREAYRQTSEALHQAEERWKFAIEGAGHGVWDWNMLTGQIVFSDLWAQLLGYHDASELEGTEAAWRARLHPDDRDAVEAAMTAHLYGGTPFYMAEQRLQCKDGSYKWVVSRGMVVKRGDDYSPLRMIGTLTDISQSKGVELALKASKMRLSSMIDTAIDAIVTCDADFNIIVFNPAAEQMFGRRRSAVLGKPVTLLVPEHLVAGPTGLMQAMADAQHGAHTTRALRGRQLLGRRADGSTFPVELSISYSDNYGRPIYTAVVRDVTERVAAENELRELATTLEQRVADRTRELDDSRHQAEAANEAKSSFLANMSHEIRTPLNSVLGMAHLAMQTRLDPQQREYLNKISLSGKHLLGLINDILDFSKIEAGKLMLESSPFSLDELLDDLRALMAEKAMEKGLAFDIASGAPHAPWLKGDVLRLRQVLLNLLSNAIKFTEQGAVRLAMAWQRHASGQVSLHFSVSDTGIGIDPIAQQHLFRSFQQADSSITRKYGGSGLGLAISYQLVQMMGGELVVCSQPGQGSEFSFTLLLPEAQQSAAQVAIAGSVSADVRRILAGRRVLVADDHPFNQQVAAEMLSSMGVQVSIAANGLEAIRLARSGQFDAVLMDMQMPLMDGVRATAVLRQEPAFGPVPIIAMTANVSVEDRQRCLDAGMNDFISKPVQPDMLYRVLVRSLTGQGRDDGGADTLQPTSLAEVTLQVLNEETVCTMLGDDKVRQQKFFDRFLLSLKEGLPLLQQAAQGGDRKVLAGESHRLKSVARTIGAELLGDSLARLESAANGGADADWQAWIDEILTQCEAVKSRLANRQAVPPASPAVVVADLPESIPMSVLLVDDDPDMLALLQGYLRDGGVGPVTGCVSAREALRHLEQEPAPDWLICDLQMPDMDGLAFLRLLAELGYRGRVAIISGMDGHVLKATGRLTQSFGLTFCGALSKPVNPATLLTMLAAHPVVESAAAPARGGMEAPLDEAELRRGLAEGAICLYYQPKISTRNWQVVGAECLARWRHPQRGILGPSLFVPVIESLGLIDDMSAQVWQQALKQQHAWQQQGLSLCLSVNLSMDNLSRLDLPEQMAAEARSYGISPQSMLLEITETRLGHDYFTCLDILTRLRIRGFGLSIDDFGTGFSTMEHLMQTPFTELKIDRAFVTGAANDAWARTILEQSVNLGHRFGLNLVAEGVETVSDLELVAAAGCHEVQGYHIARPMPAEQFEAWRLTWQNEHPA